MIGIDHTAMYVYDLEMVKEFFIRFFSAEANEMYHNPTTGLRTYFLSFGNGSRLELMNRPELLSEGRTDLRVGYTHLAFKTGSKEAVDCLTQTLKENGYEVLSGPRITGDGCYESCVRGPEGNLLELTE